MSSSNLQPQPFGQRIRSLIRRISTPGFAARLPKWGLPSSTEQATRSTSMGSSSSTPRSDGSKEEKIDHVHGDSTEKQNHRSDDVDVAGASSLTADSKNTIKQQQRKSTNQTQDRISTDKQAFNTISEAFTNDDPEVLIDLVVYLRTHIDLDTFVRTALKSIDEPVLQQFATLLTGEEYIRVAVKRIDSFKADVDPATALLLLSASEGCPKILALMSNEMGVAGGAKGDPSEVEDYAVKWAAHGNHATCISLLLQDIRADASSEDNMAIKWACGNGNIDTVRALLNDPSHRTDAAADDSYALQCAVLMGHTDALRVLLSHKNSNADAGANDNYAIAQACNNGYIDIVRLLLTHPSVDPAANRNLALRNACHHGHIAIVKCLLEDPRIVPPSAALRCACAQGHVDVAKMLMSDDRVDPSAEDNEALDGACENGHVNVAKLLLADKRVDPSQDGHYTALMRAKNSNHAGVVHLLLQDSRVDGSVDNNALILWASEFDHVECVALLLADGRVNPCVSNNTPLIAACDNGNFSVVKRLLMDSRVSAKANANEAIKVACKNGSDEVVKALLKDKSIDPQVGVRLAGKHGHPLVMRRLLNDPRVTLDRDDFEVAGGRMPISTSENKVSVWDENVIWEMIHNRTTQLMLMEAEPSIILASMSGTDGGNNSVLYTQIRKQYLASTRALLLCLGSDEWKKKASKTNDVVREIVTEWTYWG